MDDRKLLFHRAFLSFYSPICAYVAQYTKDMAEAEELVQQAFYKAWEAGREFESETHLKNYLYRSTYNMTLNWKRHQSIVREHQAYTKHVMADQYGTEADGFEINEILENTVKSLPDQCRRAFELNRFGGLKYKEVADTMGLSVRTVEVHVSKALKKLRESMKDYLEPH
ncbi:DNA-directed RNA polymerase sigma-70 factor [Fulvitalea axinellae]|uniref:DNA-directed RNA polymerase sigma-70 factor n=1 Tax=Fulvitalea axinellae TaxID=1182444 RepID=A0AAU9CTN0_9BACT|nr:DNA-directed RNA polymerase sigma-70 factor [Fulvitalea axinellae]